MRWSFQKALPPSKRVTRRAYQVPHINRLQPRFHENSPGVVIDLTLGFVEKKAVCLLHYLQNKTRGKTKTVPCNNFIDFFLPIIERTTTI